MKVGTWELKNAEMGFLWLSEQETINMNNLCYMYECLHNSSVSNYSTILQRAITRKTSRPETHDVCKQIAEQ